MSEIGAPEIRYQTRTCQLMRRVVWAIRTRQGNGRWRIVNCLDKTPACAERACAFTCEQGTWPFPDKPQLPKSEQL